MLDGAPISLMVPSAIDVTCRSTYFWPQLTLSLLGQVGRWRLPYYHHWPPLVSISISFGSSVMKRGDTMAKMYFESIAKHYGVEIKGVPIKKLPREFLNKIL